MLSVIEKLCGYDVSAYVHVRDCAHVRGDAHAHAHGSDTRPHHLDDV